jgi:hypothetical protein
MKALASAVAEESAGKGRVEVEAIASTAVAGSAMRLANIVVGNDDKKETFGPDAVRECIKMLLMCLDGTVNTTTEEFNETVKSQLLQH